jgi:hypothetical protein
MIGTAHVEAWVFNLMCGDEVQTIALAVGGYTDDHSGQCDGRKPALARSWNRCGFREAAADLHRCCFNEQLRIEAGLEPNRSCSRSWRSKESCHGGRIAGAGAPFPTGGFGIVVLIGVLFLVFG